MQEPQAEGNFEELFDRIKKGEALTVESFMDREDNIILSKTLFYEAGKYYWEIETNFPGEKQSTKRIQIHRDVALADLRTFILWRNSQGKGEGT